MPIVAGMGGTPGSRRSPSSSAICSATDPANTRKVLLRETVIGLANGAAAGTVAGLIAYYWKGDPLLGLILGVAMITNMLVAALAGTLVPVVLKMLRVDPAVATGVVVTTFTDCSGFLSFLAPPPSRFLRAPRCRRGSVTMDVLSSRGNCPGRSGQRDRNGCPSSPS
jgi:magnesium transporter